MSGVKIFTQEQNSIMGTANKLLSRFSVINFLGFPLSKPLKNSKVYGNPIRDNFTIKESTTSESNTIKIYITGGIQGSNYVNTIWNQMDRLTQEVLTDWKNSYKNTFINSKSNTATSSLNKLVNDFIFYYEKGLRANKIGIPAGIFS